MCTEKTSVNINLNEIYMYYHKENLPREGWIQGCFCCDLNTSKTIVFGFSILVLSNFIPTIYFGIFTGIAMLLAMLLVLSLLPALITLIKPFGIEIHD